MNDLIETSVVTEETMRNYLELLALELYRKNGLTTEHRRDEAGLPCLRISRTLIKGDADAGVEEFKISEDVTVRGSSKLGSVYVFSWGEAAAGTSEVFTARDRIERVLALRDSTDS